MQNQGQDFPLFRKEKNSEGEKQTKKNKNLKTMGTKSTNKKRKKGDCYPFLFFKSRLITEVEKGTD